MSEQPPEGEAPDLSALTDEEYAALLTEVDRIAQDATDETGH